MKKFLLATALAAISLTTAEANWGGFYARGGLGAWGLGQTATMNEKATDKDSLNLHVNPEISAGWGMTVANAVYLGVDAQVGSFAINYVDAGAEGAKKSRTKIVWAPNLQARLGLPLKAAMPYVAGGVGYNKVVSETDVTTLPEGNMTWSFRVGSDFKVTENFFVGMYGQFAKTFADTKGEGALKTSAAESGITVGFTAGYQF